MASTTQHIPLPPPGFGVEDHQLTVAGRPVRQIIEESGGTPAYIYSRDAIDIRVAELRQALPDDVAIHYAIKANPMPAVVGYLAGLVDGLDVASAGELQQAMTTDIGPSDISFAGPGKTDAELRAAVEAGVIVNLESTGEMHRLAQVAAHLNERPRAAIRVNPAFEIRRSGMQMGGGPKPFGIDEEVVPDVLADLAGLPLDFAGFHIFAGSQILDTEVLIECQRATIDLAIRLSRSVSGPVRSINLGGGMGIPYFPGDQAFDLERVGAGLDRSLEAARLALPETEFILELGRYLVGESGVYVSRLIDRKISRGKTFLVTDGGLHHNLAVSGNFGQVIRKNYPVGVADKLDIVGEETVDVVGCLCTPLDRLADAIDLAQTQVGDLFVVFQCGAYGASASPHGFLTHGPPNEIFV